MTLIQIIPALIHHTLWTVLITFLLAQILPIDILSSLGSCATVFPLASSSLFPLPTLLTISLALICSKPSVTSTLQMSSPKSVSLDHTCMKSCSARLVIFDCLPYRLLSKLALMEHQTSTEFVAKYLTGVQQANPSMMRLIQANTPQHGVQPLSLLT